MSPPPSLAGPGDAVYEARGDFMIDVRKGNLIELRPANSALQPITVTEDDDVRRRGVLVGSMRFYH